MPAKSKTKTKKSLNPILKKILVDLGKPEAIMIAQILLDAEGETTDEKIAEISEIKLNNVRKILYILNDNNLTQFHRVRDKKSGWFVYFWTENFDNLENFIKERKKTVLDKLEIRMKYENENYFFSCSNGCKHRYIFIEAMDYNFQCPECAGGVLEEDRNIEKVKFLKDAIIKIRHQ